MTLTDEIYRDLMDGLKTGMDYDKVRLKWETSKGPFYNALQRVFADIATELAKASSDLNAALQQTREAQQRVAALEVREKKTDIDLKAKTDEKASIEQQKESTTKQLRRVNSELVKKRGLLALAGELDEIGFGMRELRQLHAALVAIGTKRGLKAKEAAAVFFSDLKDYDAKVGFEREVQRLGTVSETSRLEAQKWQAEKEALDRAYKDKKQAVDAMESLLKQGVKPEHIPVWDKSVQPAGGVDQLSRDLANYKSVRGSVAALEKEIKRLEVLRAELSGEVNALEKSKAAAQGALTAMSKAGVDELKATKEAALSGVRDIIVELRNEARSSLGVKSEAAALERELVWARYLAANDETLRKAPIEFPEFLLRIVARYCRLKGFNRNIRVPDRIREEGGSYSFYEGPPLLELLEWALTGVTMTKTGR